jgi:hypothetical protein
MAKADEVVRDALEDLIVQAEEAPIEQSEAQAAIRHLNDMMFALDARGITLGYTAVSDLGDIITVPAGAILGMKKNLAIYLAPKYDVVPDPYLIEAAKDGLKAMRALAVDTAAMAYPSTLPRGSGNAYPSYSDQTFYVDELDSILTETGGSIALEDETEEA